MLKKVFEMKNLSKKELCELKGGVEPQVKALPDVDNTNNNIGCICRFNDNSVVNNNNTVAGCKCSCSYNPKTI